MALNFTVIYGSVRETRQGIKVAKFVVNQIKKRGHEVELIDPMELGLPLLNKRYMDYKSGEAPKLLEKLANIYRRTDAFVIVSGEYNAGIPPALKNTLDYFYFEYFYRPSGIVTYSGGPFAGMRAQVQLRAVLSEMGMSPIPKAFAVSAVQNAFNEKGRAIEKAYNQRIKGFLNQLEWYAKAMKSARRRGTPKN